MRDVEKRALKEDVVREHPASRRAEALAVKRAAWRSKSWTDVMGRMRAMWIRLMSAEVEVTERLGDTSWV